jgi:predicted RNA-binding Zn-ribbon protein involved in translation (DUF1610 family)
MSDKKPTVKLDPNASEPMMVQKGSGRLQCPKCGNNIKNMIREADDPTHKISDYPLILGKRFKCGKCGVWWTRSEE